MNQIYAVFPKIIQKFKFDGDNEHLKNTVNGIKNFTSSNVDAKSVGFNFLHEHAHKYDIVQEFLSFTEEKAFEFMNKTLQYDLHGEGILCTNSWVNYQEDVNSFMPPHIHTNAFVCSNYFLNYTKEVHAPLVFVDNKDISHVPFITQNKINDQTSAGNFDAFVVDANEGDIVFWTSELYHFVPHSSHRNRVTIAQNYMPVIVNNRGYSYKVSII